MRGTDPPLCYWHNDDPEVVERRREARIRAGHNRRRRPTDKEARAILVKSLEDAIALLAEEIILAREVTEPGINRLRAVAYALKSWAALYETGELAERVEALEAAMEVQK